ncbi:hypothetical protein QQF64_006189 [Cirrhinus molitorella]|uniref:Integrase catalytic domain-containing protein n=1 Tax=Cirrhinus molitorella TaxID=172907 RepID=A0ABR3MED5_9TELE
MVDMWSKWTEVFPSSKQDAAAVAKALLTEIVPRWGIPRKISSDNGRHFVNEAIKQVGQFWGIDMRTHCSYWPRGAGVMERHNLMLKNKLTKCCEETGLTWVKALPIVLMYMRMRRRVRSNLSSYEILFGKPPYVGLEGGKQPLPSTELCEHDMLSYCKEMSSLFCNICVQVKAAQQKEAPLHDIKPGDFVVIQDFRRKSWKAKRWLGPFQVPLTTYTAVKVAEKATWVHASHCRRVPSASQEGERGQAGDNAPKAPITTDLPHTSRANQRKKNTATEQNGASETMAPIQTERPLWLERTDARSKELHFSGEIITVTEGSSVKFNCNPFLRNCPYCAQPEYLGTSSTEYAQVYFCEHPCGWGEVKTYTRPANYGTDGRFRVAKRNQRGHNKDGMSVTIAGKYYCGIDRLGTDWYEVYTISWMSQRHGL